MEIIEKKKNTELDKLYNMCLKYLSVKMRSEKEMIIYLNKKSQNEKDKRTVLKKLKYYNFINDLEYVENYINMKIIGSLDGPIKIKKALYIKGIKSDIIDNKLSIISNNLWENKIINIIHERLLVTKKSKFKFLESTKYYLINRGYPLYLIEEILYIVKIDENLNFNYIANKIWIKCNSDTKKFILNMFKEGYSKTEINNFINSKN